MNTNDWIAAGMAALQNVDALLKLMRKEDPNAWLQVAAKYNDALSRFQKAAHEAGKL